MLMSPDFKCSSRLTSSSSQSPMLLTPIEDTSGVAENERLIPTQVMVAGSEPTGEYRVQYYVPPYLLNGNPQPVITTVASKIVYNTNFTVAYTLKTGTLQR